MRQSSLSNEAAARPSAALLGSASSELSRMPLLRDTMDRVALQGADRIEKLSAARLQGKVVNIRFEKLGLSLADIDESTVAALLDAPDWTSKLLFCLDGPLIQLVVEVLCGGDGSEPPLMEHRAFTSIDLDFAKIFCEQTAGAMMEAFAELAPSPINFERIERKLDGAVLGKPAHVSVVVEIAFEALGRHGMLGVIIPQMALDRLRPKLMRVPDDASLADPHWAQRFEAEIGRASASLTAVIEGDVLTLADVAGLQIGQVIGLQGATRNRVKLLSNDQTYFRGELGQDNGSYTVRIEEVMSLDSPLPAG